MDKNFICHSGGCEGADMFWENIGNEYGVTTIAYSFYNHRQYSKNQKILTVNELNEGFANVMIANKVLNRQPDKQYQYIKNLLSRNWYQIKNSESIYAIGKMQSDIIVSGGTGWAVQMGIDNNKEVFVFDQDNNYWNLFNYTANKFFRCYDIPILTKNFAGIGTRELNKNGKKAILEIYRHNFDVHVV